MADRTSAEVFGVVFAIIANELPESAERTRVVRQIFHLSRSYDFHPAQMEVDDVLVSLGLAKVLDGGNVVFGDEAAQPEGEAER